MKHVSMTLWVALRRTAEQHPDRDAILFGDRRVGYGEFLAEVERVAAGFYALGIRPGDRVAVWLPS